MANQDHLDILKQGVEVWNEWRINNINIKPDLSGANLHDRHLSTILLFRTDLTGTNFTNADLQEANFQWSDLRSAIFSEANLKWAILDEADLRETMFIKAILLGTHFRKADLRGADFSSANAAGAIFEEAHLFHAAFSSACLKEAKMAKADISWTNFTSADLRGAEMSSTNLDTTILRDANMAWARLDEANLRRADLYKATLISASLRETDLREANLQQADLSSATLSGANLMRSDLSKADLTSADLSNVNLIEADLRGAKMVNCSVYGIAAWNVKLDKTIQMELKITKYGEPDITVDNLKIAQFIHLLLNNNEIRDVINTITSKVVLILGRFTDGRKAVLDALRDELRCYNYLPVVFDFEKPSTRDLTETVNILAHLARFIVLDLTDPSSAPHEAATIIPHCIVPVQPLLVLDDSRHEYAMFQDLRRRYHWVLPTYRYQDTPSLLASLKEHIITPAEQKAQELEKR